MPRKKPGKKKNKKKAAVQEPDAGEIAASTALEDMQRLEEHGIRIRVGETKDEDSLSALRELLDDDEFKILQETGVYNEIELEADKIPQSLPFEFPASAVRSAPLPVPIMAVPVNDNEIKQQDVALGMEIKHLGTLLDPCEFKQLLSVLLFEHIDNLSVTHTDISDFVMINIAPSLAQKLALELDAQYKYTTAQFVQVYMKLRHVVLTHKIMLLEGRVEGLLYKLLPYPLPPTTPADITPSTALRVLRTHVHWDVVDRMDCIQAEFGSDETIMLPQTIIGPDDDL